jgi:hypothetical protein
VCTARGIGALVGVQLLESLKFCLRQLLAPDNAANGKSRFVVLHVEIKGKLVADDSF